MPKPFNKTTPLGQLMWQHGYTVNSLSHATGINVRIMSDYLAGRREFTPKHLALLVTEFDVPRAVLVGDQPVGHTPANRQIAADVDVTALVKSWVAAGGAA